MPRFQCACIPGFWQWIQVSIFCFFIRQRRRWSYPPKEHNFTLVVRQHLTKVYVSTTTQTIYATNYCSLSLHTHKHEIKKFAQSMLLLQQEKHEKEAKLPSLKHAQCELNLWSEKIFMPKCSLWKFPNWGSGPNTKPIGIKQNTQMHNA